MLSRGEREPRAPRDQNVIADTLTALAIAGGRALYALAAPLRLLGDDVLQVLIHSKPREIWLGLGIGTLIAWSAIAAAVLTHA